MATEPSTVITGEGMSGRRLHERFGVVVTIAAGTFGVAFGVGLTLLPASTRGQQGLIIVACLALSVATYAGLGAWYSAGRFVVTALSMAVVLICLASLSIATESSVRADLASGPPPQEGNSDDSPTGREAGRGAPESTGSPDSPESAEPPAPPASPPDDAPATTEEVYLSGQLTLYSYGPTLADLDTAATAYDAADLEDEQQRPDLELHDLGLDSVGEARIALLEGSDRSAARCSASDWMNTAHVSNLADDLSLCVLTSDDRIGATTIIELVKASDGTVRAVELQYIVWKTVDDA
ncbi:MAG: hypothetical protein ACRDT2_01700 [Natronosporangium sp.]